MKKLAIMLAAGLIAATIGSVVHASVGDKVTGGGQLATDPNAGQAFNTLTFYVEETVAGVRGQVQFVPTESRDGETVSEGRWHSSNIICLETDQNRAVFFGQKTFQSGSASGDPFFRVTVVDAGSGNTDPIILEDVSNQEREQREDCSFSEPDRILRGNATVHDGS